MTNAITIESPKSSEKNYPYKRSIYTEFILWTAMPFSEKKNLGLEKQGQFADYYKVHPDTLTNWKKRDDFEQRVDAILKMWSTDKTPDVIHSIYRTAVKGNPLSQQLWLGYFKGYNPKKIADEKEEKVEVGVDDIRFIINGFPEPMRTKWNGIITEFIIQANALKNAREADPNVWDERPADGVSEQADTDARNVSSERAHEVAARYKGGIRSDLTANAYGPACASESDHQGTAWRG